MVYFKVLLDDKRPKQDNIYPIVVRVTFNRTATTISTGNRINKDAWDCGSQQVKGTTPNAQLLNKTITDFYSKVQGISLQLVNECSFSFELLRFRLANLSPLPQKTKQTSFNEYASELVEDMLSINKAGNAIVYQTATRRLMTYSNKSALQFTEITFTFLDGFRRHLIKEGVKQNSISNYFRTLRAIFNRAIKAKLVDRSAYPFLDIPIKTERTAKRALSISHLNKLVITELEYGTPNWNARNFFWLSFCLTGMSFTDLAYLTPDNLQKGRVNYRRRKTHKDMSIKLTHEAEHILAMYTNRGGKYLFPILPFDIVEDSKRAKTLIAQWIKTTNKWLNRLAETCELDSVLTTYVTRHSWATTAKRLGYSVELIAECLGHEYGNKITNIYLDTFDQRASLTR